jgi:hypothetical protein
VSGKDDKQTGRTGEAAWKAHKEGVAERNEAASKVGREQRATHEREQAEARRAADVRRFDAVKGRSKP